MLFCYFCKLFLHRKTAIGFIFEISKLNNNRIMHIGKRIKEVLEQRQKPVTWLAKEINCERTNVYNIFARKDINTALLAKIGIILEYNFFKEISDEFSKTEKVRK